MKPLNSGKSFGWVAACVTSGVLVLGLVVLGLVGAGLRWLALAFGYQPNDADLPFTLLLSATLLGMIALMPRRVRRRLAVRLVRSWRRRP